MCTFFSGDAIDTESAVSIKYNILSRGETTNRKHSADSSVKQNKKKSTME